MSTVEVAIAVKVTQSNNSSHGTSIKRTFSFGDNPTFLAAGTADAIQQTAEELVVALAQGEEPLAPGNRPVVNP